MMISGCKNVILDDKKVQKIINSHLPNTKGEQGMLACKQKH
jgi:hypothetical protein